MDLYNKGQIYIMLKKIECKCDNPGKMEIDTDKKVTVAGIKGLKDQSGLRLHKGEAICLSCNSTIYVQSSHI